MSQTPTIGRVVHYRHHGTNVPAFVNDVGHKNVDGERVTTVAIATFPKMGPVEFYEDVPEDESGDTDGTWHWPPRA